jgi:hypothetical protein
MTAEVAPTNLILSTLRPGPFISGVSHSILSLGQRPLVGGLTSTIILRVLPQLPCDLSHALLGTGSLSDDDDDDDESYTRPRSSYSALVCVLILDSCRYMTDSTN